MKNRRFRDAADAAAAAISCPALIETARRTARDWTSRKYLSSPLLRLCTLSPLFIFHPSPLPLLLFLLHHHSGASIHSDQLIICDSESHPLLHPLLHSPVHPLERLFTHSHAQRHATHAPPPHHHRHLQPSWRRPSCLRPARPRRPPASRCRPRRRWTASRAGRCAEPGRGGPTARPSSATRAPRWSSPHCPCSKVRHCFTAAAVGQCQSHSTIL